MGHRIFSRAKWSATLEEARKLSPPIDLPKSKFNGYTVGSLFSGIGGIDLGFELEGFKVVWQIESDPVCRAILRKRWPKVRLFEDVRNFHFRYDRRVDVIVGGFPCQDVSVAGFRGGIKAARSGLWFEYARIVQQFRPQYVFVENVPGLRSCGLGQVLRELAKIRYDAEWESLPASAFGTYHERERLGIVAYPEKKHAGDLLEESETRRTSLQFRRLHSLVVATTATRTLGRLDSEPELDRMVYGVPNGVDRFQRLGNAVVPVWAQYFARKIKNRMKGD